ncbi:hypothetical protein LXA43DRAFT_1097883 [Ganoderma leucocontextum]|nr:hypothetical protein LXA43DRAFT_1097883 [Ganoderma leucocontextum]
MPATMVNDRNEGGLGIYRYLSKKMPNISQDQYNARIMWNQNEMSTYAATHSPETLKFIRGYTRDQDGYGGERKRRFGHAENEEVEVSRKRIHREEACPAEGEHLSGLTVTVINKQLDWYQSHVLVHMHALGLNTLGSLNVYDKAGMNDIGGGKAGYIPGRCFAGKVIECGMTVCEEVCRRAGCIAGLLDVKKELALPPLLRIRPNVPGSSNGAGTLPVQMLRKRGVRVAIQRPKSATLDDEPSVAEESTSAQNGNGNAKGCRRKLSLDLVRLSLSKSAKAKRKRKQGQKPKQSKEALTEARLRGLGVEQIFSFDTVLDIVGGAAVWESAHCRLNPRRLALVALPRARMPAESNAKLRDRRTSKSRSVMTYTQFTALVRD